MLVADVLLARQPAETISNTIDSCWRWRAQAGREGGDGEGDGDDYDYNSDSINSWQSQRPWAHLPTKASFPLQQLAD